MADETTDKPTDETTVDAGKAFAKALMARPGLVGIDVGRFARAVADGVLAGVRAKECSCVACETVKALMPGVATLAETRGPEAFALLGKVLHVAYRQDMGDTMTNVTRLLGDRALMQFMLQYGEGTTFEGETVKEVGHLYQEASAKPEADFTPGDLVVFKPTDLWPPRRPQDSSGTDQVDSLLAAFRALLEKTGAAQGQPSDLH